MKRTRINTIVHEHFFFLISKIIYNKNKKNTKFKRVTYSPCKLCLNALLSQLFGHQQVYNSAVLLSITRNHNAWYNIKHVLLLLFFFHLNAVQRRI